MGRPTKQGIDYFPIDCQFDEKIEMYLIETGAIGLAVLVTIWQMIYSNEGYYINDSEDLHLLIKRKIDVVVSNISDCVNAALRRNLFNKNLHERFRILTSKAVQKRYFEAAKKKKEVIFTPVFLLVPVDSYQNIIDSGENPIDSAGNATKEEEEEDVKEKEKGEENKSIVELKPDTARPIFEYWQMVMDHPRAAYDDKRKALIKKWLRVYRSDDLKKAIHGCSVTPHNMGENDRGERYDSLKLIFKDADQIDRFMSNDDNPPTGKVKTINQTVNESLAQAERVKQAMGLQ